MKRGRKQATVVCLMITILYLSLAMTAIQASITILNVVFNTSTGGPETVDFWKEDTVELHATAQAEDKTLSIQVDLVYPDGTSVVMFPSGPVSLFAWADIKVTEYTIKQDDPEGNYALVISTQDPSTGESEQGRISFTVKVKRFPLEIIAAAIIVAGVGLGGLVFLRRRHRKE